MKYPKHITESHFWCNHLTFLESCEVLLVDNLISKPVSPAQRNGLHRRADPNLIL